MAEEISHPSPLEEISLNTGRQSGPRCINKQSIWGLSCLFTLGHVVPGASTNNQFLIKFSFVPWAIWSQVRQQNNRIREHFFSTGLNLLRL